MSIVASGQQIANSPLNTSTSKALYSFPKEQRFRETKKVACNHYYDLPVTRDRRSTSFGYGQKIDLSKQNLVTPAPGSYRVQSEFELGKNQHRGISFGLGREQLKFSGPFKLQPNQPGPANYSWKTSTLSHIGFTMRLKTPLPEDKWSNKKSPAPGQYDTQKILGLSASGRYPVARFRSAGVAVISPQKTTGSRQESTTSNVTLGPQTYNTVGDFNAKGSYFYSKFRNSGARSFSHAQRSTVEIKKGTPGVGAYQLPSEFGLYGPAAGGK